MDKRKRKKIIRKRLRELLTTGYFINCNYHPVELTSYGFSHHDIFGSDVDGVALTNGGGCSCSMWHCNPEPITKEQALEMAEVWKNGGDRALAIKYGGYTEEQYTQFENEWR